MRGGKWRGRRGRERKGRGGEREGGRRKGRKGERDLAPPPQKKNPGAATDITHPVTGKHIQQNTVMMIIIIN